MPSYRPTVHDEHCPHSSQNEPCYGPVEARDEDCTEDYSDCWDYMQCEGHALCHTYYFWRGYKPSPNLQDQGATPAEDDEY